MEIRNNQKINKRVRNAYAWWMWGGHYLYLGQRYTFWLYVLTLGGLFAWALYDLGRMPELVDQANLRNRYRKYLVNGQVKWVRDRTI